MNRLISKCWFLLGPVLVRVGGPSECNPRIDMFNIFQYISYVFYGEVTSPQGHVVKKGNPATTIQVGDGMIHPI